MNRSTEPFPTFRAMAASPPTRRVLAATRRILGLTWRVAKTMAKVAAVIVVIGLIVHAILMVVWGRQLEHKLADLRASGEPMAMVELAPKPVPDSENAAVVYARAFRVMKRIEWMATYGKDGKVSGDNAREVVREQAAVFPLIREAVAKRKCVFPVRWQDGGDVRLGHLAKLRQMTRLLQTKAIVDARWLFD